MIQGGGIRYRIRSQAHELMCTEARNEYIIPLESEEGETTGMEAG